MYALMANFVDVCILIYLNNILILKRNKKNHIKYVYIIFEWLNNTRYHIERTKYTLFTESIEIWDMYHETVLQFFLRKLVL